MRWNKRSFHLIDYQSFSCRHAGERQTWLVELIWENLSTLFPEAIRPQDTSTVEDWLALKCGQSDASLKFCPFVECVWIFQLFWNLRMHLTHRFWWLYHLRIVQIFQSGSKFWWQTSMNRKIAVILSQSFQLRRIRWAANKFVTPSHWFQQSTS